MQPTDPTIAGALKHQGYATGQFGKNHLGDRDEFLSANHGFDEFFGNLYHLNADDWFVTLLAAAGEPDIPAQTYVARMAQSLIEFPALAEPGQLHDQPGHGHARSRDDQRLTAVARPAGTTFEGRGSPAV